MEETFVGAFVDSWDRPDGPLGNGWRSTHMDHPEWWDPLELRSRSPVNIDPDDGPIVQPGNSGGRASAYRDFGGKYAASFRVGVWWNGKHQAPGFPVACIHPDEPDWGLAFCYEPDIEGGVYILWALGRRPNEIRVVRSAKGPPHEDGRPMYFDMRVQDGWITCFADDTEVLSASVPEPLTHSSTHGFGIDVNPVPDRPPGIRVIGGPFCIAPLVR